jgi:hypothetical protein
VSAGSLARHFDPIAQVNTNSIKQSRATCCGSATEPTEMTFIHSGVDEFRKSFLFESRGVQVVQPLGCCEGTDQRLGHNQVADAESRKHSAGECSEIDDASFRVEALQGLERAAFIMELTVMVVFDNNCVLASGPIQERNAPRERQNGTGWKLVRRGHKDQASLFGEPGWIQAVAVDWDGEQVSAGGAKNFARAVVMWILDGYTVAAFYQHTGDEIQSLL